VSVLFRVPSITSNYGFGLFLAPFVALSSDYSFVLPIFSLDGYTLPSSNGSDLFELFSLFLLLMLCCCFCFLPLVVGVLASLSLFLLAFPSNYVSSFDFFLLGFHYYFFILILDVSFHSSL
jgi:hypothetical protein